MYKAQDIPLGRHAALRFHGPRLLQDDEAHQRFVREARAAASLALRPNLPPQVIQTVARALRKQREERYASAEEIRADLDHASRGRILPSRSLLPGCRHVWTRVVAGQEITPEVKAELYLSAVQAMEMITDDIRLAASVAGTNSMRRTR